MPSVFWSGRLSPSLKAVVNLNNVFAWVTGNARDSASMKERMRSGYEATATQDVTRYDELGLRHYTALGEELLRETTVEGKAILDVGCGNGVLSLPMDAGGNPCTESCH